MLDGAVRVEQARADHADLWPHRMGDDLLQRARRGDLDVVEQQHDLGAGRGDPEVDDASRS